MEKKGHGCPAGSRKTPSPDFPVFHFSRVPISITYTSVNSIGYALGKETTLRRMPSAEPDNGVVVYCMYPAIRCVTCNQIESAARKVVHDEFAEALNAGLSFNLAGQGVQQRASRGGWWWSGLLGILFALSFCPVSAGLFFGGLIPLSTNHASAVVLPALFGTGTALPVILFAFLIAFGSQYVARAFNRLTQVELWVRTITGIALVLAGLYYCLAYIYGVSLST